METLRNDDGFRAPLRAAAALAAVLGVAGCGSALRDAGLLPTSRVPPIGAASESYPAVGVTPPPPSPTLSNEERERSRSDLAAARTRVQSAAAAPLDQPLPADAPPAPAPAPAAAPAPRSILPR
jgi:hypothetical protein